jgi:hypothetical protein
MNGPALILQGMAAQLNALNVQAEAVVSERTNQILGCLANAADDIACAQEHIENSQWREAVKRLDRVQELCAVVQKLCSGNRIVLKGIELEKQARERIARKHAREASEITRDA